MGDWGREAGVLLLLAPPWLGRGRRVRSMDWFVVLISYRS